jgi:formate/nitrite transporter FocA (FNT family)
MTQKLCFAVGLTMLICLTLSAYLAYSHDAFYPHHRDDLRKDEARLTVVFITAGFVIVLGAVFYIILRGESQESQRTRESEQDRLAGAANEAAHVGCAILLEGGTTEATIHAALAAYAKRLEVVWNPASVLVVGNAMRCQIGGDVIAVRIFHQADTDKIEVKASRGEVTAGSVLEAVHNG